MSRARDVFVSVGLPVYEAVNHVTRAVESALAQDHENIELIISDNGSTDGTEEVCRDLARTDPRVIYRRQPTNVGLLNNFLEVMELARGEYFRWIGDDDRLEPNCISRGVEVLRSEPRLILVTSGVAYVGPDRTVSSARYSGEGLESDDPVTRATEMLRLLNASHMLMDPIYGMFRRSSIVGISRRNMIREDEVFAAKLALTGPWGHIPDVLLTRHWKHETSNAVAEKLGVPAWHAHFAGTLECAEIIRTLNQFDLDAIQRRTVRRAVYAMYARRQHTRIKRAPRRLLKQSRFAFSRG